MRWVYGAGLVLWLASLPVLSHTRADTWTSESALWVGADWWAPNKLRPTMESGRMAHLAGRLGQAEQQYRHAIELFERGRPAHERIGCQMAVENLVRVLEQQGKFQDAAIWSAYRCDGPSSWSPSRARSTPQ